MAVSGTKNNGYLLEAKGLSKTFWGRRSIFARGPAVRAVHQVSLSIRRGDVYGLVGESGCGKSTVARLLLRLLEPDCGTATFHGRDIFQATAGEMKELRRKMQIIFQDPYSSLNPSLRIRTVLWEGYRQRPPAEQGDMKADLGMLMERVGLPEGLLDRHPHELSGGQRQRVGIARALTVNPQFIAADEPTSALDVSVQAQILNLFLDLRQDLELTYLFISHNIGVIRYLCDQVAVMYVGQVVENGPATDVLEHPAHPYTVGLLSSVPRVAQRGTRQRRLLPGETPSPTHILPGCAFRPRCDRAQEICRQKEPPMVRLDEGHYVVCHFPYC